MRKTAKTPMNIVAMLSTVGIQEASSNPKPSAPRKSGNPTLTSRAFSVAVPAPRNTPAIPKYGFVAVDGEDVSAAERGSAAVIWISLWC